MSGTLLLAHNFDEPSGAVLDLSGNSRGFSLSANQSRVTGKTNTGLFQTGSGSSNGPSISGLQTPNRTVMAWCKQTAGGTPCWAYIHNVSSIGSGAWGILYLSGSVHIQGRNAGGFARASAANPSTSAFHHIAGTYDGTNIRLYINGVLAATTALAGPLRTDADGLFPIHDGNSTLTIDDGRLYDGVLTQSEIADLMNTPVSAGRSGKPKVWNGSAWQAKQSKVWNGSSWVNSKMDGYTGSAWVASK